MIYTLMNWLQHARARVAKRLRTNDKLINGRREYKALIRAYYQLSAYMHDKGATKPANRGIDS